MVLMITLITTLLLAQASPELMEVAKHLQEFREGWTSIEVRVREDITMKDYQPATPMFTNYVETALGQRLFETAFVGTNGGGPCRFTNYSDGKRFVNVTIALGKPDIIAESTSFSKEATTSHHECGTPLKYLYLMHQPLDKRMAQAVDLGESKVLNRPCRRAAFHQC